MAGSPVKDKDSDLSKHTFREESPDPNEETSEEEYPDSEKDTSEEETPAPKEDASKEEQMEVGSLHPIHIYGLSTSEFAWLTGTANECSYGSLLPWLWTSGLCVQVEVEEEELQMRERECEVVVEVLVPYHTRTYYHYQGERNNFLKGETYLEWGFEKREIGIEGGFELGEVSA